MKKKSSSTIKTHNYVNLERLTFLVDGVFAITMTLLVLELRPPEEGLSNLSTGLLEMLPRLYIYFIAFYSIANHWVVHQQTFRRITDADTTMLWLTMLGLLFITLIPASSAIVGRFPGEKLALACFSANSFFHALSTWGFWYYVVKKHKQFAGNTDPTILTITSQVWFMISIGWLISIGLGFLNTTITYISWILWPNLVAIWGSHRRSRITSTPSNLQE